MYIAHWVKLFIQYIFVVNDHDFGEVLSVYVYVAIKLKIELKY